MRCDATVSSMFFRFGPAGNSGASSRDPKRPCSPTAAKERPFQAAIAAISGLMPTMFMTRVRL
jgi:hypothetical protein